MDMEKLINERVSQKASSIKITRQAENKENALKAEFNKWADKYEVMKEDRESLFIILEKDNIEIKDNGEIMGVKQAVETLINKYPTITEKIVLKSAPNYPRHIGGN